MSNKALTIGIIAGLVLAAFFLVLVASSGNSGDKAINGFEDDNIEVVAEEGNGSLWVGVTMKDDEVPRHWGLKILVDDDFERTRFHGSGASSFSFPIEDGEEYQLIIVLNDGDVLIYLIDGTKQTMKPAPPVLI